MEIIGSLIVLAVIGLEIGWFVKTWNMTDDVKEIKKLLKERKEP